jgi:uncharacterized metal-binding protein
MVKSSGMDTASSSTCGCGKALKIIYACSGASDVGEISDRAARRLSAEGAGKMSCIAGIGGRAEALLDVANAAAQILAIDGCPLNCVKKTLELAGYENFEHIGLHDLGMPKGKSPVTEENIEKAVKNGRKQLSDS